MLPKPRENRKKNIHNISENVWSEVHVWLFLFSSVLLMCVVLTSKNKSSGFFGFIFGYTCGIEIAQIKTKLQFLLVLGRLWCGFLLSCGLKKTRGLDTFWFSQFAFRSCVQNKMLIIFGSFPKQRAHTEGFLR
jgi:hypothetical protein